MLKETRRENPVLFSSCVDLYPRIRKHERQREVGQPEAEEFQKQRSGSGGESGPDGSPPFPPLAVTSFKIGRFSLHL